MNLTNLVKAERRQLLNGTAVLTALVALAALGSPTAAFGEDAIAGQEAVRVSTANNTPEGSWVYTVTATGIPTFTGIETYSAGGGYVEADQLSFLAAFCCATAGHGVWQSTGVNTFLLTYVNLTYSPGGAPTGALRVRQTTKLNGTQYSGSGDFAYYDLNEKPIPGYSGTFTITAKRIPIEAPQ